LIDKYQQTQESRVLVDSFKQSIEKVRIDKETIKNANMGVNVPFSKEDMNAQEKRKVLENFVENDNALSLLLDFISNKHMTKSGNQMIG